MLLEGGDLRLVLGTMFSGKTTYLLSEISRYVEVSCRILYINSEADTRSTEMFSTHNPYIRCGSIDQRCTSKSIDQRCTSKIIDQRCTSKSIDQRCTSENIDQRCTSENIDQRCIDQRYTSISIEQKCNEQKCSNRNNNNNNVIQPNLTMLKTKNLLDINIDDYDIIAVDESHFFTDLREFVKRALLSNKSLIVAGLIADSRGEKFGQTLDLVPICTDIVRLKAYCSLCAKSSVYRVASHSKCILKADEVMLIGGADKYIPVCREHYNLLLV